MPRLQVEWFANQMEQKLKENDHKGGWDDCDIYWLLEKLDEEVQELKDSIDYYGQLTGHKKDIVRESADVANIVMMIADIANKRLTENILGNEN